MKIDIEKLKIYLRGPYAFTFDEVTHKAKNGRFIVLDDMKYVTDKNVGIVFVVISKQIPSDWTTADVAKYILDNHNCFAFHGYNEETNILQYGAPDIKSVFSLLEENVQW